MSLEGIGLGALILLLGWLCGRAGRRYVKDQEEFWDEVNRQIEEEFFNKRG